MRNTAFLAVGLALLVIQSNLFRLIDRLHVPGATPSLLLPLVVFMGVHEYSMARGAALAFTLGYLLDLFAAAPIGLFTFITVATFVVSRAAGVRLAAQTWLTKIALALSFALVQGVLIVVLTAIFGNDQARPRARAARRAARDRDGRVRAVRLQHRRARARCHRVDRAPRAKERRGDVAFYSQRSDVSEFKKRFRWIALAMAVFFVGLVGRLFQLQVVEAEDHRALARENIVRKITLATTRGIIRDRSGNVLAANRPAYNIYVVPANPRGGQRDRKLVDYLDSSVVLGKTSKDKITAQKAVAEPADPPQGDHPARHASQTSPRARS